MAAGYTVVDSDKTVQVLPGDQAIDVQQVGFVTSPSGVYAVRLIPWQQWLSGDRTAPIQQLAQAIEDLISGGLAVGGDFVQDTDPVTRLLTNSIEFVVAYTVPASGLQLTTRVRIPVNALTVDTAFGGALATYFGGSSSTLDPAQALRDAYDALAATAGG